MTSGDRSLLIYGYFMAKPTKSGTRFLKALELRGENYSSLSRKMGTISKMSLASWRTSDIGKAGMANVMAACKILNIRPEWLVSGQEPMSATGEDDMDLDRLTKVIEAVDFHEKKSKEKYTPKQKAFLMDIFYHDHNLFESRKDKSTTDMVRRLIRGVT